MSDLPAVQTFQYQLHHVRVVEKDGEPWFVEIDVQQALERKSRAIRATFLLPDEKGVYAVDTLGGTQNLKIISESGLYRYLMRSNARGARKFQDWVVREVLPSVRKTSRYQQGSSNVVSIGDLLPALQLLLQSTQNTQQTMQLMITSIQQTDAKMLGFDERLSKVEAIQGSGSGYVTLMGYGRLRHIAMSVSEARNWGLKARAKAKELGLRLGKAPDERFGSVNTYPIELLDELLSPMHELERIIDQP